MNDKSRADVPPGLVELQLLRHGPPHNQLLSPLTEYLALCGDHPNTTLRIPLEHSALETRLRALNYRDSEETRIDQLREMARIASELLARVPGLIADLSSDRAGGKPFVHLSIASRASELALFPFELALAPDGFPGAGQALCLQKRLPVCLTRRSKNVRNDGFDWDRSFKILLVASDAGGEIPLQQHYALLRKLVEPWVGTMPSDDPDRKKRKRRRVLRLLTQANVDKIQRTLCDEVTDTGEPFTHIHVLAHGCDLPETDRRSGIALHHPTRTGIDGVDGRRLAEALGCLPDFPSSAKRVFGPTVVTLATCGSAEQGSVKIPGASLAFELHDSGIPLVVGSQFPLSADGSVIMTEAFYRGLLAGRDPRSTIWETRQALQANMPQLPALGGKTERAAHDWASLTVYAAFPGNLDGVMPAHRRNRQRRRMNVRLRNMERVLEQLTDVEQSTAPDSDQPYVRENCSETLRGAGTAVRKFDKWVRNIDNTDAVARANNKGILASAQKQVGLLNLRASVVEVLPESEPLQKAWAKEGEEFLHASRRTYWEIFKLSRDESWALVQFLALDFALRGDYDDTLWSVALQLGLLEEHVPDVRRRIWALSVLLELQFLACLKAELNHAQSVSVTKIPPIELARRIHDLFGEAPWDVYSAKRQFDRYVQDFGDLANACREGRSARQVEMRRVKRGETRRRYFSNLESAPSEHNAVSEIRAVLSVFDDIDFEKLRREDELGPNA